MQHSRKVITAAFETLLYALEEHDHWQHQKRLGLRRRPDGNTQRAVDAAYACLRATLPEVFGEDD